MHRGRSIHPHAPSGSRKRFRLRHLLLLVLPGAILYQAGDYYWREKRWHWIIVHHTASDAGDMEYYRQLHQKERGWPDIGYHFLINNGSFNTTAGQIEVSSLWTNRSLHYSTKRTVMNYFGIAVALVGNFSKHKIPHFQEEALIQLLARLSVDHGVPPERIVAHREVWNTECPGKFLAMDRLRHRVKEKLETMNSSR